MKSREVTLPHALRLHPKLSAKAKLLWTLIRAEFPKRVFTYQELREAVALRQPALKSNLVALAEAGWLKHEVLDRHRVKLVQLVANRQEGSLNLPLDLLLDRRLKPHAMWLWAIIRTQGKTTFTQKTLAELAGQHPVTVARGLHDLSTYKWLTFEGRGRSLRLKCGNPFEKARRDDLVNLEREIEESTYGPSRISYGQTLARLMIEQLTGVTHLIQNARPEDVVNPDTQAKLEYDLYYPEYRVAVEFHGPQHRGTTQHYPDSTKLLERRKRDLIKLGLSHELGIKLIVIWATDLRFNRLAELLEGHLPIRHDFSGQQHLIKALTEKAEAYMHPWLEKQA